MTGECFVNYELLCGGTEMGALQVSLHGQLDVGKCIAICYALEYKYAGLQNGNQCFCDNHYPYVQAPYENCQAPCEGDHEQLCGGRYGHVSVFITSLGRPIE